MVISGEIEKLEKRWHENPTGLMFAPLAEAHRKAGNAERALEILEAGLTLHPEYVPAQVVRGRCHLDTGDFSSAEAAFEQVLARDPMHQIAIRGLAEVYERMGRTDRAIERLEFLTDVDRNDVDARLHLERLRNLVQGEQTVEPESTGTPETMSEIVAEEQEPIELRPPVAPAEEALVTPLHDMASEFSAGEPAPDAPPGESVGPVIDDVVPTAPEWSGPIAWTPAPVVEDPPSAVDEPVMAEPVAEEPPVVEVPVVEVPVVEVPAVEVSVAEVPADAPVAEVPEVEKPVALEPIVPEPVIEEPLAPAEPVAEVPAMRFEEDLPIEAAPPPASEAPSDDAELVITASMAELFLRQGHRELAAAVYRQLVERTPEDEDLRAALARIQAEGAPEPAEPARACDARTTGGRSVEAFLRGIVQAPPPVAQAPVLPPPAVSGEPTRAATEALSLGAVFGDEMPAPPSGTTPASLPAVSADKEPSYDEFFGPGPGGGPGGSTDPDGEDLQQFNEWLRGLKR